VVIGGTALLSIPLLVLPIIVFVLVLIAPCFAISFCLYHKCKKNNKVDPRKQPTKKKQHGLDDDTDKEKDIPTLVPHNPHVPIRQITVEPALFYAKEAETKRKLRKKQEDEMAHGKEETKQEEISQSTTLPLIRPPDWRKEE
jgi:hypothetical protein